MSLLLKNRVQLVWVTVLFTLVVFAAAAVAPRGRFVAALHTNVLRVRLERLVHLASAPPDPEMLNLVQSSSIATDGPGLVWLAGYYVLTQTGSYTEAARVWAFAPKHSAQALSLNSARSDDKVRQVAAARTAYQLNSASSDVRRVWVEALIADGGWKEAASQLDILLSENPNDALLNAKRGLVEDKRGGSAEVAKGFLLRARELDPLSGEVMNSLVNHYRDYGTVEELEQLLLAAASTGDASYRFGFYCKLIDLYLRQDQLSKIPASLEAALAIAPQHPWINRLAGEYFLRTNQYPEAIRHFSVALVEDRTATLLIALGDAWLGSGDQIEAMRAYCEARASDSDLEAAEQRLSSMGVACE